MKRNLLLLMVAAGIVIFPLVWHRGNEEAKFAGADDQAGKVIEAVAPDYKPWFSRFWEPPSTEVASLLFAVQAAIGSGIFCFGLGWMMGRAKERACK